MISKALETAGERIHTYGVNPQVVGHILGDDNGHHVTMYLSQNLQELDKINAMPPMQAAVYIENQIKPKAMPKREAPPPVPEDVIDGEPVGGATGGDFGGLLKGATFT